MATAPAARAQGNNPSALIEKSLPQGQTLANASKADLLSAICSAVQKNPKAAPQIVRVAVTARPELAKDILRTAFRCAGSSDCSLLGRILRGAIAGAPDQSSALTSLAIELSPDCSGSFQPGGGGGSGDDGGNYGNAPGNQNPPPGTIGGGGGGQGTVVAVCFAGTTRFLSPQAAEDFLRNNPGAKVGPCVVTPVTNQ